MNRNTIGAAAAALTLGALTALAYATPAAANHNQIALDSAVDGCTITADTTWTIDEHQVANTALVIHVDGQVHAALVGDPLTVDLPAGTTTADWRIWGGGERDYDNPPLADLDALLTHLAAGGSELDADAPGVAWHELAVDSCPAPEPTPTPTAVPTPTPTPTVEATPDADETPAPPAPVDDPQLPVTGANWVPTAGIAGIGIGLLAVGAGLLGMTRRRTTE